MRKLPLAAIAVFSALASLDVLVGGGVAHLVATRLPIGPWQPVALAVLALLLVEACALATYRLCLWYRPLVEGPIEPGSPAESAYNLHLLFHLVFFNGLRPVLPTPLVRVWYLALGAKLGPNSYSAGAIHEPTLVTVGANCILGAASQVIPHVMENERLELRRITLGDNVTLGANSVVAGGCTIGDDAILAFNSVLSKGSVMGPGETWMGLPARGVFKRRLKPNEEPARQPPSGPPPHPSK
ncbi:MAG: DapH/DapD/GlmU-related protein [Myxococcales bacterium]